MGNRWKWICAVGFVAALAASPVLALSPDSERLGRAKDLIADEQWRRAIVELRAAMNDPKESARDEAAFWLAHSLYQSGDIASALQTLDTLERQFPRSRWIFPARSLRIEIAQRLNRHDMLWSAAVPAPPAPRAVAPVRAPTPPPAGAPAPAVAPTPGGAPTALPDVMIDIQIQALGSLIDFEPGRAVPILKELALTAADADQARRAIFVLAQSDKPGAHEAVIDLAERAPEPVSLAAVRELGTVRWESPRLMMRLYQRGSEELKTEVIRSLGTAGSLMPLADIARGERDRALRELAVAQMGRFGARVELAKLYADADPQLKPAVINALFSAVGDDELIRIARTERDPRLRAEVIARLKLLGTPAARAFVRAATQ